MTANTSNGNPLVDAEARRQAVENLTENLWVEAGAGTGKTTLLIERLVRIVTEGAARLEQVAAITFTEKAAAELKARLREKLEDLAASAETINRGLICQALDEIETAPISTIHSFAASLLRERPVEAGLDPRFAVADSDDLNDLLDQVWEQWLVSELQHEAAPLKRALNYGCSAGQLASLGKMLYHQRDLVWEGRIPEVAEDGFSEFLELLQSGLAELALLVNDCKREDDRGYQYLEDLDKKANKLLGITVREEQERYLLRNLQKISSLGSQLNWEPKESCRRQKEICRMLDQSLASVRENLAAGLVADLIRWCKEGYLAAVEDYKHEEGILDFQDLLLKCRNLLRDSLAVRRYFQERFRYLLVDEFQDTDPLQVDLVFLLAEREPRARHWQDVDPREGKLFLVGDPKQSIYRFRRADIEIYQAAKNKILEKGQLLNINQNFRTVPALLDWVNHSFSRIIQPQENYQPDYQNLSPYRKDHGEPALVILESAETLDDASADEVRVAEAEAAASLIVSMVGSRTIKSDNNSRRFLSYGDIALLFPTTTGLEHYEEALRSYSIPYHLEGGKRFYQQAEIIALKNLLSSVANPYDRLSLFAVLRYWGGVPDEDLYLYSQAGGELSYLSGGCDGFPAITATMALLREAHHQQHSMSLSALVEKLLKETWFWQRSVLEWRSRQSLANLRKVIQLIRAREQEQALTLKGFTHWLEKAWSDQREEEESLLHDPGGEVVQILTIHRSKGLEFPAVFLLNAGGSKKFNEPFLADRAGGSYYLKISGDFVAKGYGEALEKEKMRLEAERKRLLYVAATRARDYFVLPRFHNSSSPGYWKYFSGDEEAGFADWPGGLVLGAEEVRGETGKVFSQKGSYDTKPEQLLQQRSILFAELDTIFTRASLPAPYLSAGDLIGADQWQADEEAKLDEDDQAAVRQDGGLSFGSAFHRVMEEVNLHTGSLVDLEERVTKAALNLSDPDRAELKRIAEEAFKHPLLDRVRQSSSYYRELPFVFNLSGRVIEGIVDLLFIEDSGLVIVDYKTDDVTGSLLEKRWQHYKRQGQIYALAMAEITGLPVKEISFYFVRHNNVKTIGQPDPGLLKSEIIAIIEETQPDS